MSEMYKLSPSDLTFLWDECKRCFYLKVVRAFSRPKVMMPSIFIKIDGLMKSFFNGKITSEFTFDLPEGKIQFGEKWVESIPITIPGHTNQCYIRGKFDCAIAFSDGTYGVVDFKTSTPKASHIQFYGRQLHAYAYALENPAPRRFSLKPISRLGLLVVEPESIDRYPDGRIAYLGNVTWQEIEKHEEDWISFLDQVLTVLEKPEPPDADEKCEFCKYRSTDVI